jgi:hypothetical protein
MAYPLRTSGYTISAANTAGAPIPFQPIAYPGALQAGILVILSTGASLTYNVEVTGDDINAPGYNPATGNWIGFTNMVGLTVSAVATLGAVVMAIRLHVGTYTSGSATIQFIQQTAD